MCLFVARRAISLPRGNPVAFGPKRTLVWIMRTRPGRVAAEHQSDPDLATDETCEAILTESSPQPVDRFALARRRAWNRSSPKLAFDDLGSRSGSVI